jgi:hypothetical protein
VARIHEALGLTRSPSDIGERGGAVVTQDVQREIGLAARALERMARDVPVAKSPPAPQLQEVASVFLTGLRDSAKAVPGFFDTLRRVRYLAAAFTMPSTHGPAIVDNVHGTQAALSIIDERYRDGMLPHLFYAMLQVWGEHPKSAEELRRFIARRCEAYDGRRRFHQSLRHEGSPFLAPDAPTVVARSLLAGNAPLMAPIEWSPLPDGAVRWALFGAIASAFASMVSDTVLHERMGEVLAFITEHGDSTTAKKVLSELVSRLHSRLSPADRTVIQRAALSTIGDPRPGSVSWASWDGASTQEKNRLERARNIVNSWISEHLAEMFFRKVTMDEDRRRFWQPYVGSFYHLKIYANPSTMYLLRTDPTLREAFRYRVGKLEGGSSGNQNALVMETEKHVLVEFGHTGRPFCAHLRSSEDCPDTRRDRALLDRLNTGPRRLAHEAPYARFGRFNHQGNWQRRLEAFLRYNGIIS